MVEFKDTICTFAARYLNDVAKYEWTPSCLWNPVDQPVLAGLVANLPKFAEWVARRANTGCLSAYFRQEAQIATDRIA